MTANGCRLPPTPLLSEVALGINTGFGTSLPPQIQVIQDLKL